MQFEFIVKVEDYKEKRVISYGNTYDDALSNLYDDLNASGYLNIQYIVGNE